MTYAINSESIKEIANATRELTGATEQMTPTEIAERLRSFVSEGSVDLSDHTDAKGNWIRPEEYPSLDSVDLSDFEGLYLTYDLRKMDEYSWIGIQADTKEGYLVERGHMEIGVFVTDEQHEVSAGDSFRQTLDADNGEIQLWRVSGTGLSSVWFKSSSENGYGLATYLQPCVERTGRLPNVTDIAKAGGASYKDCGWTNAWLERDKVQLGGKLTSLANSYRECYSLQELDVSGWETSDWKITDLKSMFWNCIQIKKLDLNSWDTSNWAVTSTNSMFGRAISLRDLLIDQWDTSNWVVTSIAGMFRSTSIANLKLGWNTSNWKIESLGNLFSNCYSLKSVDLNSWDTSGWTVTAMESMFANCYVLKQTGIDQWDTSNWAVNTLSNAFQNNCSRRSIDFSSWDTSKWNITKAEGWCSENVGLQSVKGTDKISFSLTDGAVFAPFKESPSLKEFDGLNINSSFSLSGNPALTKESLVKTIQVLRTVKSTAKLQLHSSSLMKLTDAEIAAATEKGWTVTA